MYIYIYIYIYTHTCCSVLQCVAVCGSALQCVAATHNQHASVPVVRCVAVYCSVPQCVVVCYSDTHPTCRCAYRRLPPTTSTFSAAKSGGTSGNLS